MSRDELKAAYEAGFNSGLHGSNTSNCHFGFFRTPEMTEAWIKGRDTAVGKKDDDNLRILFKNFTVNTLPKIKTSAITMTIVDKGEDLPDAQQCLELGAVILLGKPLVVVVREGCRIPPGLMLAASAIVEIDGDLSHPSNQEKLEEGIARAMGSWRKASRSK
jgi:ribosome modulation factor